MAVTRNDLFDKLGGAFWSAGVTFERANPVPIEKYSVFKTLEEATTYASSNPVAYPGQPVAVVAADGTTTLYIIEQGGALTQIGADTAADLGAVKTDLAKVKTKLDSLVPETRKLSAADKSVTVTNTDGTYDADTQTLTAGSSTVKVNVSTTENNILELKSDGLYVSKHVDIPEYTIEQLSTATSGMLKTYQLKKDGTAVGAKIDIPKDFLVKEAHIHTVETADTPYAGAVVGEKYIHFVLNTKDTESPEDSGGLYIPIKDLVDPYYAGNGIVIGDDHKIAVKAGNGVSVDSTGVAVKAGNGVSVDSTGVAVKAKANSGITVSSDGVALSVDTTNGLKVGSSGVGIDVATQDKAGAMSAADKTKLDSLKSIYSVDGTHLEVSTSNVLSVKDVVASVAADTTNKDIVTTTGEAVTIDFTKATVAKAAEASKTTAALTFGTKTFNGSTAQEITAADLGALTENPLATNTSAGIVKGSTADNKVSVGADGTLTVNTITVDKLSGDITAAKTTGTLTAGTKTFDGSADVSLTAGDVGAYSKTETDTEIGKAKAALTGTTEDAADTLTLNGLKKKAEAIETSVSTSEEAITELQEKVTTAESDIDTLQAVAGTKTTYGDKTIKEYVDGKSTSDLATAIASAEKLNVPKVADDSVNALTITKVAGAAIDGSTTVKASTQEISLKISDKDGNDISIVTADGTAGTSAGLYVPSYSVIETTPDDAVNTIKSYAIVKDGVQQGAKIDIPKDFLLKSGSVKTCTVADTPLTGLKVGDKYLDFVLNTADSEAGSGTDKHMYINVNELFDSYTAGNKAITVNNTTNTISLKLSATTHGLSVGTDGLTIAEATADAAGAMSAADKTKLDDLANVKSIDTTYLDLDTSGKLSINTTGTATAQSVSDLSTKVTALQTVAGTKATYGDKTIKEYIDAQITAGLTWGTF